jgi:nicotinic acid mononucleotide adenylyltransferase
MGFYWGAFDPPTQEHLATVEAAMKKIPLEMIIIVLNNHKYKEDRFTIAER